MHPRLSDFILLMIVFPWPDTREQISFSRAERQGGTYVEPVLDLIRAVQDRRRSQAADPLEFRGRSDAVIVDTRESREVKPASCAAHSRAPP